LDLVVEVVVLLDALPFESAAELVVVVSVLTFLPLSRISVFEVELESVVDCSAFWANIAVEAKKVTKISFFIRSSIFLARTNRTFWLFNIKIKPALSRYAPAAGICMSMNILGFTPFAGSGRRGHSR